MQRNLRIKPAFWRLASADLALVTGVVLIAIVAIAYLLIAPLAAIALAGAACLLGWLVLDRAAHQREMQRVVQRLSEVTALDKLEVTDVTDSLGLDRALNALIQRTREHTSRAQPLIVPRNVSTLPRSLKIAVLTVGLRHGAAEPFSDAHIGQLQAAVQQALAHDHAIVADMESGGTLLLTFGSDQPQPIKLSVKQALETARLLSANPDLRFSLSCGMAQHQTITGAGMRVVGAPYREAARLLQMATTWHEYQLLCAEPIALLARTWPSQRTMLKLNNTTLALPVYAIDLSEHAIMLSA